MSEVESLEAHFFELKSKLNTGALSPEEFRSQVARLWFEDEQGHTWMIGAQTGHWYVYKNDRWTQGEPPRADSHGSGMMDCPRCGEHIALHAAFCGHCGYQLAIPDLVASQQEASAEPKSAGMPSATTTAPRATPRMSRRVLLATGGAIFFGVTFLCLSGIGLVLLLRSGGLGGSMPAAAQATATATRAVSASRVTSTPTPSVTPTALPPAASPVVVTIAAPTTVPQTAKLVATPVIVYIETETPTPAGAAALVPTATATATPSPVAAETPTALPATATVIPPTATTAAATHTPAPPTNTPVPRPPTATPVPAVVLSGRIAFTVLNPSVHDRPIYDVVLSGVDGANRTTIAPRRRQPVFSPDGGRLLTMGMDDNKQKLLIKDVNTGQETDIGNTPVESMLPSWSPDGATVLFAAADLDDRQSRLYIVDARGAPENRTPIRTAPKIDLIGRYPTWLPDGQIVYTGCDKWGGSGQCGIIRVNPDGGSPTFLTANERDGTDTAPSGNGSTVLFMSNRDGNWEVYAIPLSGGAARNLTSSPGDDGLPVFSPDGKFIAFVSNRSGQWAVWAMRADGSDPRQLFTLDGGFASGAGLDWTSERLSWTK
ncbi:MAG: PD40 domain-containing protein [Chloroflexi bacterium]|nr:PD40 domain-containing protein [Chloroflexota bacterium]